jgi:hypothetical protein
MSGATPSRSHPPKGHHLGGQSDGVAQYEHLGSMIGAISEERCLIMTGGPDESQLAGPQHSQPNMNAHEQPLTEKDALAWLLAKPSIETTVSELSRQWGWNRTKVLRRLKRWADDGYLIRTTAPGGRSVITTLHKGVHPPDSGASTSAILVPRTAVAASSGPSVHPAEGDDQDGHVLAWFGIRINAWYGGTLGKTAEASALIAGLSVSADLLALVLPATARTLWVDGHRVVAGIAWALWAVTIVITLIATIGFAALNVTDVVAARTRVVAESAALTARIERLQFERAHVTETRSVGTIEAELQRVQPSAASVWRATSGCRDVTIPESGHACAEVLALREALGTAQRRDVLDVDLDRTEAQLARLPSVTAADPQSETATRLVNWATFGVINLTANDVNLARVTSMILTPQTAGLVLLLAMTLWPSGGRNAAL